MFCKNATAIVIQDKLRINPITMIFNQPINAIRLAAFFVRRKCENDVSIWHKPFLLEAKQSCDHDGIAIFHVLRATAIEVTILLHELKWIRCPVFATRLNHIEMAN